MRLYAVHGEYGVDNGVRCRNMTPIERRVKTLDGMNSQILSVITGKIQIQGVNYETRTGDLKDLVMTIVVIRGIADIQPSIA